MTELVADPITIRWSHVGWSVAVRQLVDMVRRRDAVDAVTMVHDPAAVNHVGMVNRMAYRVMDGTTGTNAPTVSSRSRFHDKAQCCDNCQAHNQAIHCSSP